LDLPHCYVSASSGGPKFEIDRAALPRISVPNSRERFEGCLSRKADSSQRIRDMRKLVWPGRVFLTQRTSRCVMRRSHSARCLAVLSCRTNVCKLPHPDEHVTTLDLRHAAAHPDRRGTGTPCRNDGERVQLKQVPISGVARQPRHFKAEHDADAAQADFGHWALEAFPVCRTCRGRELSQRRVYADRFQDCDC
jgi:hypothetical protein